MATKAQNPTPVSLSCLNEQLQVVPRRLARQTMFNNSHVRTEINYYYYYYYYFQLIGDRLTNELLDFKVQ